MYIPTFPNGWDKADSDHAYNAMLRTGYLITFAGCPVL